jgi:hypothetical protein
MGAMTRRMKLIRMADSPSSNDKGSPPVRRDETRAETKRKKIKINK